MFNFTDNQAAAINTLDRNVSVSAGAGSGKTRVLVERFINILAQGLKNPRQAVLPKEILAITFTRKAAAEMKERIRKRLYELEQEDAVHKTFWHEQRQNFDQARISTIHGFCNGILKENPVETELDPSFSVAEENDMQEFLENNISGFIKKSLAEQNENIIALIRAYGINGVKNQLLNIYGKIEDVLSIGDLSEPYVKNSAEAAEIQAQLISVIDELIAGIGTKIKSSSAHGKKLQELAENRMLVAGAVRDFSTNENRAVLDMYIGGLNKRSADKEVVAEAQDLVQALYQTITDNRAAELIAAWQPVLCACAGYVKSRQAEQNLIGFDDLESLTLKLLLSAPEIRHKYQQNFKYIMVDEFQDTNERQREIIYLLCSDDKDILGGSKLFVVGDPKQSIYRFRGADVNVFARVRRDIKDKGGRDIVLNDNFRTVDKILDFCNNVFPVLLGLDETKDVFFEALKANFESDLLPELMLINYDAETTALSAKEAEACCVAQKIKTLHDREGIAYKDIVILLRAMTNVDYYQSALNLYGIPCNVVDGKGFYERQEVIDFINLLTVCADSRRSLELAGVLRSPYFAVNDETITSLFFAVQESCGECSSLWQLLTERRYPDYINDREKEHLNWCADILTDIYHAACALPLTDLFSYIEKALDINVVLASQPGGEEKLANLKKLFSLANDFCLHRQGGLREYLDNIKKLQLLNAREASALADNAQESVTVMTIHKSKGLEFPVVILPSLESKAQADSDQIRFNKNIGLGIKADIDGVLLESSVFTKIKTTNNELDKDEKERQFYVAVTRAKERLILSGIAKASKTSTSSQSWFKKLCSIVQDFNGLNITAINSSEIIMPEADRKKAEAKNINNEILANINPLPDYGKAWQQSFSASALQQYNICPRSYYYHYILQMPAVEPEFDGENHLDAKTLGTLIHEALEKYSGNAKKALMQAAYNNNLEGYNLNEAEKLLTNYLQSSIYPGLKAKQLHETGFSLPVLAQYGINAQCYGFIDNIIFNDDNTLTIIDYKTGHIPQTVQKGYRYQLALYKLAAEQMFGMTVKKAELHFLRGCVSFSLDDNFDPQEIAFELRGVFNKNKEADFVCRTDYCSNCVYSYFCKKI